MFWADGSLLVFWAGVDVRCYIILYYYILYYTLLLFCSIPLLPIFSSSPSSISLIPNPLPLISILLLSHLLLFLFSWSISSSVLSSHLFHLLFFLSIPLPPLPLLLFSSPLPISSLIHPSQYSFYTCRWLVILIYILSWCWGVVFERYRFWFVLVFGYWFELLSVWVSCWC